MQFSSRPLARDVEKTPQTTQSIYSRHTTNHTDGTKLAVIFCLNFLLCRTFMVGVQYLSKQNFGVGSRIKCPRLIGSESKIYVLHIYCFQWTLRVWFANMRSNYRSSQIFEHTSFNRKHVQTLPLLNQMKKKVQYMIKYL